MGYPHFNRTKAVQYLIRQFGIGGFFVQHIGEFELCISWRPRRVEKEEKIEEDDMEDFPTLVNLKKTANKYRGARK